MAWFFSFTAKAVDRPRTALIISSFPFTIDKIPTRAVKYPAYVGRQHRRGKKYDHSISIRKFASIVRWKRLDSLLKKAGLLLAGRSARCTKVRGMEEPFQATSKARVESTRGRRRSTIYQVFAASSFSSRQRWVLPRRPDRKEPFYRTQFHNRKQSGKCLNI